MSFSIKGKTIILSFVALIFLLSCQKHKETLIMLYEDYIKKKNSNVIIEEIKIDSLITIEHNLSIEKMMELILEYAFEVE
jgi:hypothetical protein